MSIIVDYIIDNSRYTTALINGLSDHDAQFLTINNTYVARNKMPIKQKTRLINSYTLTNFQTLLKQEMWESVYQNQDVNCMFNSFLSTFLNIFEASFPVKYKNTNNKNNDWITQGIKISCKHKRSLYTFTRNSNDPKAKTHYINYCRIIKKVIKGLWHTKFLEIFHKYFHHQFIDILSARHHEAFLLIVLFFQQVCYSNQRIRSSFGNLNHPMSISFRPFVPKQWQSS